MGQSMPLALKVEKIDGNILVKFTRPEIRNPISVSVLDEMNVLLDSIASDRRLKKVIFTGANEVFASGADLRWFGGVLPAAYSVVTPYVEAVLGARLTGVLAAVATAPLLALLLVKARRSFTMRLWPSN